MLLDAIKAAVRTYIPVAGNKIKRVDHVNANDTMISALYYSDWGIPKPYFSYTLPEGYVWCNIQGQTVNVADCHPAFVEIMGPMFPVYGGDGVTTIGIPYIPGGSSLVQTGSIVIGSNFTPIELGAVGGAAGVVLDLTETPAHAHHMFSEGSSRTGDLRDDANKNKTVAREATSTSDGNNDYLMYVNNDVATRGKTSTVGGYYGSTQAHNNMSPYFAVNYILRIK